MSEESDSFDRVMPDFSQMLAQRLATGQTTKEATPTGNFDPYKMMLNKKKSDDGEPVDTTNTTKWPVADVKALEDFCKTHGITGVNCGLMSPIAALAMLKSRLGIVDGPLEERVPAGYEKMGTVSKYNQNFPYESAMKNKSLLKG